MPEATAPEGPRRRNILFITTDQQRYDSLGCNGGTVARTPVVDRLAAEGINYRRAYNQNTVCMPARSTMLTGQYVRTHGVVANGIPLPLDAPSVAQYLHDAAGYRTALLGKAHFEPGFDPQNQFEENARVARGDTGPWRGFERSQQAMHAAAWGDHPIAHYGRWLKEHHPEHLHSFAGLLQAEPGGDTLAPETKNNPIPRAWYHTDWVADLTVDWLRLAGRRRAVVLLDVLSRPAPPVGPASLRAATACPGRTSTCRRVTPAPTTPSGRCWRASPPHWLAFWDGRFPNMEGGPAAFVPSRLTHDQIREINAKVHVMNELIDEACGRVLRTVGAAGLARRHRRRLHHRPRRDAGRLRPPLQGPVPHRCADAAAVRVAAGPVRRHRPGGGDRSGGPGRPGPDVLRHRRHRAGAVDAGQRPAGSRRRGRVASARCASGTASSPATACTCARSTATAGCAPSTSPRRPGNPTASRRCGATRCSGRARWSTSRRRRVPAGSGIATGELYNVDDDPYQFENRWDDPRPACAARRPGGRPLRQPARPRCAA